MDLDRLPHARVFREAGAEVAPPSRPVREQLRGALDSLRGPGREAAEVIVGLWPLTVIMIVAAALIWSAGT
jgi:hypothetical protein